LSVYFVVLNDRLANVRVTVGKNDTNFDDPPEDEICDYLPGQPPADIFLVTCHTRMYGRYVRVTAVTEVNQILNLYELEIHGLEHISKAACTQADFFSRFCTSRFCCC